MSRRATDETPVTGMPGMPGAVGRGLIWSLLNTGMAQALSLLIFLGTARFVSKEAFGIMAISLGVVELLKRVTFDSFATAVNSKKDVTDHDFSVCFTLCLATSIGLAAMLFLASDVVARLINSPQIEDTLRLVSALLVTIGLSRTHEVWLSRHLKFKPLAVRSLVSIGLAGSVGLGMAASGFGLWSLVGQQLTFGISSLILLWTATPWRPAWIADSREVLESFRNSTSISLSSFWTYLSTEADIFFVSAYLGPIAAGIYNVAKRIMLAVNQFLSVAVYRVALSAFANAPDEDRHGKMLLDSVQTTSIVTAPAFAGLAALAGPIVHILLGPSWSGVAPVLSALALAGYLMAVTQYNQIIFFVRGKPHYHNGLTFAAAALNIVFFIFAARYGATALALALALRTVLMAPISTNMALRMMNVSAAAYLGRVLPSLMSAGIMGLVVAQSAHVLRDQTMTWQVVTLVPLGVLLYGLCIIILDRQGVARLLGEVRAAIKR